VGEGLRRNWKNASAYQDRLAQSMLRALRDLPERHQRLEETWSSNFSKPLKKQDI
jgi:hypothetical protein